MTDKKLIMLAQALTSDPPRPVEPADLVDADRNELAAALRRAVAGLPPAVQRARLAGAFRAISALATGEEMAAWETELPAAPQPVTPAAKRWPALRQPAAARAGMATLLLVLAVIAGGLVGRLTDRGGTSRTTAATLPVPVLLPLTTGSQPPSPAFVAGLLPPDPARQAAAASAAAEAHPDQVASAAPATARGAAPSSAAGDPGQRIAGYADGSAFFATPSSADAARGAGGPATGGAPTSTTAGGTGGAAGSAGSASSPAGAAGGTAAGGTAAGGTAAGGSRSGSAPGLVDGCASDTPPPGCSGVPGTIVLTDMRFFRFNADPQAVVAWPDCLDQRPLRSGEFLFELQTGDLGTFTIRYRPAGSSDPFTEVTGTSPAGWRAALDSGSASEVLTCIPARRPADGAQRLEVQVSGVGLNGSGTDSFTGVITLPAAPGGPQRRAGRPPVTVQAVTSSTLQVTVPVGAHEDAKVTLLPRGAAGLEPCANPAPGAGIAAEAYPGSSVQHVGDGTATPWTDRGFRVSAPAAGSYSVCVSWFDDGTPPRNLERASVPVEITAVSGGDVLLAGYEAARAVQPQPNPLDVTIRTGSGAICGSARITPDQFLAAGDRSNATTMCHFDGAPGYLGMQTDASLASNSVTQRALLAVPASCGSHGGCTTWWTQTIFGPGHVPVGAVVVGIRISGGTDGVTIGVEHPVLADTVRIHGPRLRTGQVSVTPSSSDPRAIVARWAAVDATTVLVSASPSGAGQGCPTKTSARSAPASAGTITLGGLCPGQEYFVSFDLMNGSGRTIYNAWNQPAISGVDFVARSWPVTTHRMPVTFDYQLRFALSGRGQISAVVPTVLSFGFPDDGTHTPVRFNFSQYYDGRARMGLDCAEPAHYNRSGSGIDLNLSGGTFGPAESSFIFDTYWPTARGVFDTGSGRICPSLFNQVHHTPSVDSSECHFSITRMAPENGSDWIDHLLSGGAAHFSGSAQCLSNPAITLTATLTVHMGQVRTLHGRV